MRQRRRALAFLLSVVSIATWMGAPASQARPGVIDRIAGADRYATAALVATGEFQQRPIPGGVHRQRPRFRRRPRRRARGRSGAISVAAVAAGRFARLTVAAIRSSRRPRSTS